MIEKSHKSELHKTWNTQRSNLRVQLRTEELMSYDRTTVSASWKTKVIRRTKEVAEQSTKRIAGGSRPNPTTRVCLTEGVCLVALVSTGSAVQQQ